MKNRGKYLIGFSIAVQIIVVLAILLINRGPDEKTNENAAVEKKPVVEKERRPAGAGKTISPKPEKAEQPASPEIQEQSESTIAETETAGSISGTVYREETGEPIRKANVRLAYPSDSSDESYHDKTTISDTDGFYFFDGLSSSTDYMIEAKGTNLVSDPVHLALDEREERENIDLHLYSSLAIKGKVVLMGTDTPVEGVELGADALTEFETQYGVNAHDTSNKEGRFVLGNLRAGDYRVYVDWSKYRMGSDAFGLEVPMEVTLTKDQPLEPILVEVRACKSIRGKITDENDQPIERVRIQFACFNKFSGDYMWWEERIYSNKDGHYQISGLYSEADKFKVRFRHGQYADLEENIQFEKDKTEKVIDIMLEKGLSISGFVRDKNSEPVVGAEISASPKKHDYLYAKHAASDSEGYYNVVGITSDKWELEVTKPGYGTVTKDDEALSISGKILIGDKPLDSQRVRFNLQSGYTSFGRYATTDTEGGFIIADLEKGYYDIKIFSFYPSDPFAEIGRFPDEMKNVAAGTDDLIIRIRQSGSIAGYVKDAVTLEIIKNFVITFYQEDAILYSMIRGSGDVSWIKDGQRVCLKICRKYSGTGKRNYRGFRGIS